MNSLQELSRRLIREEKQARLAQDTTDRTVRAGRGGSETTTSKNNDRVRRNR